MRHKTLAVFAATGAALALLTVPAEASSGSAGCPRPLTANVDHGRGAMNGSFTLKAGPYAGRRCATVARLSRGRVLYFQCWTKNSWGNRWVYARVKGTSTYGWTSIDNLREIETRYAPCPTKI